MRSTRRHTLVYLLSCASVSWSLVAAAQEHHTATVSASIGSTLEILTRTPDLAVLVAPDQQIYIDTGTAGPGLTIVAFADSLPLDIANTMYARASLSASASNASTEVFARSSPGFDLINQLDTPMAVQLRVSVPGVFPETGPPRLEPNPYLYSGRVDDNWAEISRVWQEVTVLASREVLDTPISVLFAHSQTREPLGTPGMPTGPVMYDAVGVPFQQDYEIIVPSSFTEMDSTIEIRLFTVTMWTAVHGLVASILDGSATSPITFNTPPLCQISPPRSLVPFVQLVRDPLCRIGRAGASSPVCTCLRDDGLRNQRCGFTFPDVFVNLNIPAPALAGEKVDADFAIQPWAASGDYWLESEIFVEGKWVPIPTKAKPAGRLSPGKEVHQKMMFTMPKRPTIFRTRLFQVPKGSDKPVVSQMVALVALKKPPKQ